ncbi:AAA family ATPase [Pseudosulfitobacter sp. DSM 107133]|uniref:AAA family ATPase n=1 Tax=Pseudosulfitobacter sp. DSM 107133 TaxID=2883100 RepID=UPI000DF14C82|nr:AAA family ATPase [Pseudosulfitobacter sp. DSM 107133]
MTTHLSARLTWHDTGWNGRICSAPGLNSACMEHEHVREGRDLNVEVPNSGCELSRLLGTTGYMPPCARDANTFGHQTYMIRHNDPVPGRALPSVDEEIPAFSICPTPYRWMLEASFRDIVEDENLLIRGPVSATPGTWVQEDDRQRALLDRFWGKLDAGASLVFFYCNRGNAVDDDANRLIVGVSRIMEVAEPSFFGASSKIPGRFPVWSRRLTHDHQNGGVRIPYQEYIAAGLDVETITCRPPRDLLLPFSYVAEHLSDGQAVSALLAIISIVERLQSDQASGQGVPGDWGGALEWLNSALDEVWAGRGAYPGMGALLRHLGYERGVAYHATVLRDIERRGVDPWEHLSGVLERRISAEAGHEEGLARAAAEWQKQKPSRQLLELLVQFELTSDQFSGIANAAVRKERGIEASNEAIIENPYCLYEQDFGTDKSAPVGLEVIDQGMLPEGEAAHFRKNPPLARNDRRRVRAVMRSVLRDAADSGDTILPLETLITRTMAHFPESRRCNPDLEVVWDSDDRQFYDKIIWFKSIDTPATWHIETASSESGVSIPDELSELQDDLGAAEQDDGVVPELRLVALKRVRRCEIEIAQVVREQVGRLKDLPEAGPDWGVILTKPKTEGGFGTPETAREANALTEKTAALETLYRNRLSVLTGGAGTGKTSVLKAFLTTLREVEGPRSLLLAAPTGKARVRLQTASGYRASTIHQILWDVGLLGSNYRLLDQPLKGKMTYATVVIDESSMPSVELLAALFRGIATKAIMRLIFVGDVFQLPPIGPGRPFLDILRWLRKEHPSCIAELETCMRVESVDGEEMVSSGLRLAAGYRDESGPGDDEIIARAARCQNIGDLSLLAWEDHDDLLVKIDQALNMIGIAPGDNSAFDASLGITTKDWKHSESWQILTPTRIHAFGAAEINRVIHDRYRAREIGNATNPYGRLPGPMGDQGIVIRDKVMQVVNQPKWLPKDSKGLRFVANGEIGLVTQSWKKKSKDDFDKMFVAFSTQPEAEYRYGKSEVKDGLELAYALTVHKAQGSDFGTAIVVLPRKAATLSRELLYTALTRFRDRLVVLVERDTAVLDQMRNPIYSETARRSTFMFDLLIGDTAGDLQLPDRYRPEGLIHRAQDGTPMRSKSEVIVYEVLSGLGLAPVYEQRLYSQGSETDYCLPDFTIQHGGKTWYWEHLGMLNRPQYREDWIRKEAWYHRNGFADRLLTSKDHEGGPGGILYADEVRSLARDRILGTA